MASFASAFAGAGSSSHQRRDNGGMGNPIHFQPPAVAVPRSTVVTDVKGKPMALHTVRVRTCLSWVDVGLLKEGSARAFGIGYYNNKVQVVNTIYCRLIDLHLPSPVINPSSSTRAGSGTCTCSGGSSKRSPRPSRYPPPVPPLDRPRTVLSI